MGARDGARQVSVTRIPCCARGCVSPTGDMHGAFCLSHERLIPTDVAKSMAAAAALRDWSKYEVRRQDAVDAIARVEGFSPTTRVGRLA